MNTIFAFLRKPYLATLVTLVIFVLCVIPNKEIPDDITDDKTAHLIAFGTISFLWQFYFSNFKKTFLGLLFFGIMIEAIQHILPEHFHRGFEIADIVADTLGIIGGLIANILIKKALKV